MSEPLLETVGLTKSFPVRSGLFGQHRQRLFAVDDVSLAVASGETLGLVGESGCGKSTLALTIMRLYEPTSGSIRFAGRDIAALDGRALRSARAGLQMIFQDPFAALDPRLTVEQIVREPLDIHNAGSRDERHRRVRSVLERVGLAASAMERLPNEFSGGQQQRIGIARALVLEPRLLLCDEPVSALDVSVQAQILNLLRDLQDERGLSYLFISHNIAVTAFMSRRIGVMYLGRLVEIGPSDAVISRPRHPYTEALVAAVPEPDPQVPTARRAVVGDVPSPIDRPGGCPFHPRCPIAQPICSTERPELRLVDRDHAAACHFA